jgi:hypothetical protein
MEATREIFWHIPLLVQIALYLMSVIAIALIGYSVYKRYQMWTLGKPTNDSISLAGALVSLSDRRSGTVHCMCGPA